MMKKLILALSLALAPLPSFAAETIKSGHVLGNGTSAERTPTDTPLFVIMQQSGSGFGTGVATALGNAVNTAGGVSAVNGTPSPGDCLKWSASGIQDAGAACSSGSATLPSATASQLYGGTGSANSAAVVNVGTGLSLSGGTLIASGSPAPAPAYTILGYGQSTMESPFTSYSEATCAISSGAMTCSAGIANGGNIGVGSTVGCKGCPSGLTISALNTGTGVYPYTTGSYTLSQASLSVASGSVYFIPSAFISSFAPITSTAQNTNAYMISAGLNSPRAIRDTFTSALINLDYPVIPTAWTGFQALKETSYGSPAGYYGGIFFTETPLSSMAAQFIQEASIPASAAVIAVDGARGSAGWAIDSCTGYGGPILAACLSPGSTWWSNLRTAQKFVKEQVEYGTNVLANNPGYLQYQLSGVAWRHGEVASQGNGSWPAAASFTSGSSTTITMANSAPVGAIGTHAGQAIWDNTAACFVGYEHSWVGTTLTLAGNDPTGASTAAALCTSSGSTDGLWFSEAYNYKAELADVVARVNQSLDISDAPLPTGVPVIAAQPSTWAGVGAAVFGAPVYSSFVDEALADPRFVLAGPSFMGQYQGDTIHQTPQGNALVGAYMGQWLAWHTEGKRTVPFIMTQATVIAPSSCDGTHYCLRVTFTTPPTATTPEKVLQFYTDSNIPAVPNYGFQYTDGTYVGRTSSLFKCSQTAASGITIAASPQLATASLVPGSAQQIDIPMSANPTSATNGTVCLGGATTGNGQTFWGVANANLYGHNVADKSCHSVANTALQGKAFTNAACGTGSNYLINFAAQSMVGVNQSALTTAW